MLTGLLQECLEFVLGDVPEGLDLIGVGLHSHILLDDQDVVDCRGSRQCGATNQISARTRHVLSCSPQVSQLRAL